MAQPDSHFVVRDLFPSKSIHLIFGPAHSGKTTLMLQIMEEWRNGRDVLGYHSHPAPFCYVSCTKQQSEIESHMRRIGLDPNTIPNFSLLNVSNSNEDFNIDTVTIKAKSLVSDLRVLFLDGLSVICPGRITDVRDVAAFLRSILTICRRDNITIIAAIGTVKSREGSSYSHPIERLPGAGVWSEMSNSKILIDPIDPKDVTDNNRYILVMPRSRASWRLYAEFVESGMLAYTDRLCVATMDSWLQQQAPSTQFTTAEIQHAANSMGVSRATVTRWIADQRKLGTLTSIARGLWQIPIIASA